LLFIDRKGKLVLGSPDTLFMLASL
jgi:hypothetical protein